MRLGLALSAPGLGPAHAHAQQVIFGYQLGVTETAGTIITDNPQLFVAPPGSDSVTQLSGLQLNTGITANATLDILTRLGQHGFLAGLAFNQLIPAFVPDNASASIRQATSALQATATYLGRVNGPRWSFGFGGGYTFGLNGQLPLESGGGVGGEAGVPPTLPGRQVGFLLVNQQAHSVNGRLLYQLSGLRWDLELTAGYAYQVNGLFSLAPGAVTAAGGSSLGAFVPTTFHNLTPSVGFRRRIGDFGNATANLSHNWVIPSISTATAGLQQLQAAPQVSQTTLTLGYLYNRGLGRSFGVEGSGTLALRVPTNTNGRPLLLPDGSDRTLAVDTVIYTGRVVYNEEIRSLALQVGAQLGVSQARLYQPPLGQATRHFAVYQEATVGSIQPVAELSLRRRFEPVDLSLILQRAVGVGGLGASAVITESANLTSRFLAPLASGFEVTFDAGLSAARTRGVGADLLPENPENPRPAGGLAALTTSNDSIGLLLQAQAPLYGGGGMNLDLTVAYNFIYTNPSPEAEPGALGAIDDFSTQNIFATLRFTFGRGPLNEPDIDRRELDEFSSDPRSGGPLISARLMNQGRSLSERARGIEPDRPNQARRDSRQALQIELQQAREGRGERGDSSAERGTMSTEEEERAAQDAEDEIDLTPPIPPRFDAIPEEDLVRPLGRPPESPPESAPPPPPPEAQPPPEPTPPPTAPPAPPKP